MNEYFWTRHLQTFQFWQTMTIGSTLSNCVGTVVKPKSNEATLTDQHLQPSFILRTHDGSSSFLLSLLAPPQAAYMKSTLHCLKESPGFRKTNRGFSVQPIKISATPESCGIDIPNQSEWRTHPFSGWEKQAPSGAFSSFASKKRIPVKGKNNSASSCT